MAKLTKTEIKIKINLRKMEKIIEVKSGTIND